MPVFQPSRYDLRCTDNNMSSDEPITTKAWSLVSSYENKCLDESAMRSDLSNVYLYNLYTFYITLQKHAFSKLQHSREEKEL